MRNKKVPSTDPCGTAKRRKNLGPSTDLGKTVDDRIWYIFGWNITNNFNKIEHFLVQLPNKLLQKSEQQEDCTHGQIFCKASVFSLIYLLCFSHTLYKGHWNNILYKFVLIVECSRLSVKYSHDFVFVETVGYLFGKISIRPNSTVELQPRLGFWETIEIK